MTLLRPSIEHTTTTSTSPNPHEQVSGIITSASAVRARAVAVRVQCAMCHMVKVIPAQSGFGGIQIPTSCDGEDPNALADGSYTHVFVCSVYAWREWTRLV